MVIEKVPNNTESKKYLFCRDNDYLKDLNAPYPTYPIFYPLVITHSFWYYLKENNIVDQKIQIEEIKELTTKALDVFKNKSFFYTPKLFEIFCLDIKIESTEDELYGFVFVDRSYGCYPLMLYPIEYAKKDFELQNEKGPRIVAFTQSLESVKRNADKICSIFRRYNHNPMWSFNMQDELSNVLRNQA